MAILPGFHKSVELFLVAQCQKYGVDLTNKEEMDLRIRTVYNPSTGVQMWLIDEKEVMALSRKIISSHKVVFVLELTDTTLIVPDKKILVPVSGTN